MEGRAAEQDGDAGGEDERDRCYNTAGCHEGAGSHRDILGQMGDTGHRAGPDAQYVPVRTNGRPSLRTVAAMNVSRIAVPAALVVAIALSPLAGCTSAPATGDKTEDAAYTGAAVTLSIGTDDSPGVPSAEQISHFAGEVSKLSGGKITIDPRWHAEGDDHPTDWDQAVAALVQEGHLDLALGPTWAWDVLGVTSFQPLQAPFLVDSDELVAKVITDGDLAGKLMAGLPAAGVEGIALWPEGLRHPFGFTTPLIAPGDYAGTTVRSPKSVATTRLLKTLGAATTAKEPDATTMVGLLSEFALKPNGIAVSNITFFPKVNLLYANAKSWAGLDPAAQQVLTSAAATTRTWAIAQASDQSAGSTFCTDGGTIVQASSAEVDALKKATATMAQDFAATQGGAAVFEAISRLKTSVTPSEPASACTGQQLTEHKPGKAEARLNGTYRFTLTKKEFLAAGLSENDALHNAGVQTFVLANGKVHFRLDPTEHEFNQDTVGPDEADGTYQVDGRAITLRFPVFENEVDRLLFEVADNGNLTMTALDVSAAGVSFYLTSKPWKKIS